MALFLSTVTVVCSKPGCGTCCRDNGALAGDGAASDLRSAVHLHRVASVGEVLVTQPGTVTGQVQSSASEVPLLKKGHLTGAEHIFVNGRTCLEFAGTSRREFQASTSQILTRTEASHQEVSAISMK